MKSDYGKKARTGSNEPYRSNHDNINWNKGDNMFKKIMKIVGFIFYGILMSMGLDTIMEFLVDIIWLRNIIYYLLIFVYVHYNINNLKRNW